MRNSVREYKKTLFDRYGPEAGDIVRALSYGLMVFGLTITLFSALAVKMNLPAVYALPWVVISATTCGAVAALSGIALSHAAGSAWKRFMVEGLSTPYKEQYSYQQALVMQGKVVEALESFEAVMAEKPDDASAHIKAAELYAREMKNPQRAAELFRRVQRIAIVEVGEDIYASNRLVDLYTGPLADPGRAIVELRRLIDRYPGSAAAGHARDALARLKAEHVKVD